MQLRFVGKLRTKVKKRPGTMLSPLCFFDRYPFADALQILQGNPAVGVLRTTDKFFRDTVVDILGEALFFPLASFQQTLGRSALFRLELRTQFSIALAQGIDFGTAIRMPVAVTSDLLYAKVNTQKIVNIFRRWFVDFAGGKEIEHAVNQAKVRLATITGQKLDSTVMRLEGNTLEPTINRPDANLVLVESPTKNATIEGDRAKWLKLSLYLLVELISVSNFGNTADNKLRSQTKLCFHFVVGQLLDLELTKRLFSPSNTADKIARLIRGLECSLQAIGLRFGRYKLYLCC